jgi:hypothetical protein
MLNDSAVLSGTFMGTGTITFTLTQPNGTTITVGTDTVSGDGTYTAPSVLATEVGTYTFHATYSGDSLNNGAIDNGANESVTTIKAPPMINTIPGGTVTIGSGANLTDSATLSGGFNPTGTITFTLFDPSNVSVYTNVVTVNGNGTYDTSTGTNPGGFLPDTVGTYHWVASYSGDANNNSVTSGMADEPETVIKATPMITTVPGPTVVLGSGVALTDTATLSGGFNVPQGTITFTLFDPSNVVVHTEIVSVDGNGDYSTPDGFIPTVAGTFQWVATYSGDANNNSVNSPFGDEPEIVTTSQVVSISGIKFNDLTGNGFSPDDPRLGGVTINLFRDIDGNGTLDSGDGPPIASMTTAADGTYSFINLPPGTYFVQEVVPTGAVQTGGPAFYTVTAPEGGNFPNLNFANHFTSMIIPIGKMDLLGSNFSQSADGNILENIQFVNSIYHSVLGRAPDQNGFNGWFTFLISGGSRFRVAAALWDSPEHRDMQVEQFYETILHRTATPAERTPWVNALSSGAVTEISVEAQFLASPEYQAAHTSNAAFITGLYNDVLGRAATASELADWEQALANGLSRAAVEQLFLGSTEFAHRIVDGFYMQFLNRPPDPIGEAGWIGFLRSGGAIETVAENFLASDEYFQHAH